MAQRRWWVTFKGTTEVQGPWTTSQVVAAMEKSPDVQVKPEAGSAEWIDAKQWWAVVQAIGEDSAPVPEAPRAPQVAQAPAPPQRQGISPVMLALGLVGAVLVACNLWVMSNKPTVSQNDTSSRTEKAEPEPAPPSDDKLVEYQIGLSSLVWDQYDAATRNGPNKGLLLQAIAMATKDQEGLREPIRSKVIEYNATETRRRFAKIGNVHSYAGGTKYDLLVPSTDAAECMIWGSMWSNDAEVRSAFRQVGFTAIWCATDKGGQTWSLKPK